MKGMGRLKVKTNFKKKVMAAVTVVAVVLAAVLLAVGGLLLIGAAGRVRGRRDLPGVLIGRARLVGFQLLGPRRRDRARNRGKKKKTRAGGAVCALLVLVFLLLPAAGRGWLLLGAAGGRFRWAGTTGGSTVPASTVFLPGDAPKCRRAKGSDSTPNGISPHR